MEQLGRIADPGCLCYHVQEVTYPIAGLALASSPKLPGRHGHLYTQSFPNEKSE